MKIIECPRDAMQGLHDFVPTASKIAYINTLLEVGFDTIDFGSFVSPKAIPQLRDTAEVLAGLNLEKTASQLLAIIANERGANDALNFEEINYLGFPLSISEQFQQRNTKKSIIEALKTVENINNLCQQKSKTLVCYISMGFGNPYGEEYNSDIVGNFTEKLDQIGIQIVSLADTIGSSSPQLITSVFSDIIPAFPHIEIGAHFHSTPQTANEKLAAAFQSGCRRIDGAIGGMGGCPMAKDDLVGNIATENIFAYLENIHIEMEINQEAYQKSLAMKTELFG